MVTMDIKQVSQGALPYKGEDVLVWDKFGSGSWAVARFNGPTHDNREYYWDCDTFGMREGEVEFWANLPPSPVTTK